MHKSTKIIFALGLIVILGVSFVSYWKFYVYKDFNLFIQADCNPTVEQCFVGRCDAEAGECTGYPAEDEWYYKEVTKSAHSTPLCNPAEDENCNASICEPNDSTCEEQLCDPEEGGDVECLKTDEVVEAEESLTEEAVAEDNIEGEQGE